MNVRYQRSDGFSLVEILLGIVVFGIAVGIVSMVAASMAQVERKPTKTVSLADTKACRIDQSVYAVAVQAYKLDNGKLPTSDADIAPNIKETSKYWTVTDSGKSADRIQPKAGVTLPSGCVNDPKT